MIGELLHSRYSLCRLRTPKANTPLLHRTALASHSLFLFVHPFFFSFLKSQTLRECVGSASSFFSLIFFFFFFVFFFFCSFFFCLSTCLYEDCRCLSAVLLPLLQKTTPASLYCQCTFISKSGAEREKKKRTKPSLSFGLFFLIESLFFFFFVFLVYNHVCLVRHPFRTHFSPFCCCFKCASLSFLERLHGLRTRK